MKFVALVDKKGIKSDFACSKGFVVRQSPKLVHVVNIRHKQTSFMQTLSTVHGQEFYRQSPPAKVQPTGTSMEGKLSPLTSLAHGICRYAKIVCDLFYVHHVICLPLQKDGSIIYNAREILSIRFFLFLS